MVYIRLPDAVLATLGGKREKLLADVREFNSKNDLSSVSGSAAAVPSVTSSGSTPRKPTSRVACEPVFDPPNLPINPSAVGSARETMKVSEVELLETFGNMNHFLQLMFLFLIHGQFHPIYIYIK